VVDRVVEARLAQLRRKVPQLFDSPGTVLYVGASTKRAHCAAELVEAGNELTLLEIYPENAVFHADNPLFQRVVQGDVRDPVFADQRWDVAFWWHGPAHVAGSELGQALANLETHAGLVVLGCPWGSYPQTKVYRNPHERHRGKHSVTDFERFGYEVATLGTKDQHGSNLLAWKVVA